MLESEIFYEMSEDPSDKFARIEDDLIDENGEALVPWEVDPDLRLAKAMVASRKKPLSAWPFIICSAWLLISDAAYAIAQQYQCCSSIRWIPTDVTRPDGSIAGAYWLAHGAAEHDIWDYVKSDFTWLPNIPSGTKEAVAFLNSGVARRELIPEFDVFQADYGIWIASSCFAKAIVASGLKGFCFSPLRIE